MKKLLLLPIFTAVLLSSCSLFGEEKENNYKPDSDYYAAISEVYKTSVSHTNVNIEPVSVLVRDTEATITDEGRAKQKMDVVYLDYDYKGLMDLGYMYLDINITLQAKEVDDGYQYIFLYNTPDCQSVAESILEDYIPGIGDNAKKGLLAESQFEIGPGEVWDTYELRKFHFQVSTGNMIDYLYIRYGASGKKKDTWRNKDVHVDIQPIKTKNI